MREDEARQIESDAILKRMRQETSPQVGAGPEQMVLNPKRHFSAGDVDPDDRIEVVGTRIGRWAGFAFFIFLAGSLIYTYLLS